MSMQQGLAQYFRRELSPCFARMSPQNLQEVRKQADAHKVEGLTDTKDSLCYALMEAGVNEVYGGTREEDQAMRALPALPLRSKPGELPLIQGEMALLIYEFTKYVEAVQGLAYYLAEVSDIDITAPAHLQVVLRLTGSVDGHPVVMDYSTSRGGQYYLHVMFAPQLLNNLEGLHHLMDRALFVEGPADRYRARVPQDMRLIVLSRPQPDTVANFLLMFTQSNVMAIRSIEFCYGQQLPLGNPGMYRNVRPGKRLETPMVCREVLPQFENLVAQLHNEGRDRQLSLRYQAFQQLPELVRMLERTKHPISPETAPPNSIVDSQRQAQELLQLVDNFNRSLKDRKISNPNDMVAYLQLQRMLQDPAFVREFNDWNRQSSGGINALLAEAMRTGKFADLLNELVARLQMMLRPPPTMIQYLRPF